MGENGKSSSVDPKVQFYERRKAGELEADREKLMRIMETVAEISRVRNDIGKQIETRKSLRKLRNHHWMRFVRHVCEDTLKKGSSVCSNSGDPDT